MAEEQMAAKGFNDNFSAYCADLIRRDREEYFRRTNSDSANVAAFMEQAGRAPLNSTGSPAFQAIFDAGVAAATALAAQSEPPPAVRPVTYTTPARSTDRKRRAPKKKV